MLVDLDLKVTVARACQRPMGQFSSCPRFFLSPPVTWAPWWGSLFFADFVFMLHIPWNWSLVRKNSVTRLTCPIWFFFIKLSQGIPKWRPKYLFYKSYTGQVWSLHIELDETKHLLTPTQFLVNTYKEAPGLSAAAGWVITRPHFWPQVSEPHGNDTCSVDHRVYGSGLLVFPVISLIRLSLLLQGQHETI